MAIRRSLRGGRAECYLSFMVTSGRRFGWTDGQRAAAGVLIATAVLVASAPAGAAASNQATTFNGSCTLTGDYQALPPSAPATTIDVFEHGIGTCTGSLNGGPSKTHIVTNGGLTTYGVVEPVYGTQVYTSGSGSLDFDETSRLTYIVAVAADVVSMAGAAGSAGGTISGGRADVTLTFTTFGTLTSLPN